MPTLLKLFGIRFAQLNWFSKRYAGRFGNTGADINKPARLISHAGLSERLIMKQTKGT